jgi:hypothetical protein
MGKRAWVAPNYLDMQILKYAIRVLNLNVRLLVRLRFNVSPDVSLVGAVFDVFADRFEHPHARRHPSAVEYLEIKISLG